MQVSPSSRQGDSHGDLFNNAPRIRFTQSPGRRVKTQLNAAAGQMIGADTVPGIQKAAGDSTSEYFCIEGPQKRRCWIAEWSRIL